MTQLLEQFIAEVSKLPEAKQDAIAALALEELHSLAESISQEEADVADEISDKQPAGAAARRIAGAFKDDATLMDEVVELAMDDRQRRNSAPNR